jgi:long-chain acyl-CoA synthetase
MRLIGLERHEEGQEIMIAPLPLYHIYAFTGELHGMMLIGNHNVLITNPRDLPGFVKELASGASPVSSASTPCSSP